MRHKVYGKKLGRDKNQRDSLFKSLVQSLILSESIETTQVKAKAVKGLVDKIINQAKTPSTRKLVSQFLINKKVQDKLVKDLLPRLKARNSGYTSLVKMGRRLGDNSMVVKMSLLLDDSVARSSEAPKKETSKQGNTSKRVTRKREAKK